MEISFTTVTFRQFNIDRIYYTAARNSITAIEWGGDIHLPYDDSDALELVLTGQKATNIGAISYGSYYSVGESDYDKFGKICLTASRIGARIVRVWLGDKSSSRTTLDDYNRLVEEMRLLCHEAAQYNLVVASEFHNNTYNDNGKAAVDFINDVAMDNCKTYWQQLGRFKTDLSNLQAVIPHVAAVHVFNQRSYSKRYSLAKGKRKWLKFIEVIRTRQDVPLIMEFVRDDDAWKFAEDLMSLRELVGGKL